MKKPTGNIFADAILPINVDDAVRDERYAERMKARAIRLGAPDPDEIDEDEPDQYGMADRDFA